MEVLRIKVYLTDYILVEGHADKALMLPFTVHELESPQEVIVTAVATMAKKIEFFI